MYYFCSDEERAVFAKDPSKFAQPGTESAAEHKH